MSSKDIKRIREKLECLGVEIKKAPKSMMTSSIVKFKCKVMLTKGREYYYVDLPHLLDAEYSAFIDENGNSKNRMIQYVEQLFSL